MGITNITLYGAQVCDYIYIKNGDLITEESYQLNNVNFEPKWIEGSEFIATFKNNLTAGNNEVGADFVGWTIYRKNVTDNTPLEYVSTITDNNITQLADYMVVNHKDYKYYLFLNTSDYVTAPFVSNNDASLHTDWWEYTLITAISTSVTNELKIQDAFVFQLNLEPSSMSNNANINKLVNFTQYPKIQYSDSNHLSGTLKSLIGYIGDTGNYVETQTVVNKLRNLTTDGTRKFLKDIKGNIYEIAIDNSINFDFLNSDIINQPLTIEIPWIEIRSTENISITYVNDLTAWVLTKSGIPEYGMRYLWLPDNYVDANRIVTANIISI